MTRSSAQSDRGLVLPPLAKRDADRLYDLIRLASARSSERAFVVEGPHLLERALEQTPRSVRQIVVTQEASHTHEALLGTASGKRIPLHSITAKTADRLSDTRTPQGLFAEISMPDHASGDFSGLSVVLDRVQDPGNVGTIIRTAAWFDAKRLILSAGTADCYNPKVLRATQGEIFSVEIEQDATLSEKIAKGKNAGVRIIAATANQVAGSLYKMQVHENAMFIFGSEAHGVGLSVEQNADELVTIPRFGAGESLNVAMSVGIILAEYTARKRRLK